MSSAACGSLAAVQVGSWRGLLDLTQLVGGEDDIHGAEVSSRAGQLRRSGDRHDPRLLGGARQGDLCWSGALALATERMKLDRASFAFIASGEKRGTCARKSVLSNLVVGSICP